MSEQDKTTMSAEEVLQKFDKESDKRNLTGMWDKLISFICIAFAVFQLYTLTESNPFGIWIFFDLSAVSRQEKLVQICNASA